MISLIRINSSLALPILFFSILHKDPQKRTGRHVESLIVHRSVTFFLVHGMQFFE